MSTKIVTRSQKGNILFNYGTIGMPTNLKDVNGAKLCIGDIVLVKNKDLPESKLIETIVVASPLNGGNIEFYMGRGYDTDNHVAHLVMGHGVLNSDHPVLKYFDFELTKTDSHEEKSKTFLDKIEFEKLRKQVIYIALEADSVSDLKERFKELLGDL